MALTQIYTLTYSYQGDTYTYTSYDYSSLISLVTNLGISDYDLTSTIEDITIESIADSTDYTSEIVNTPNSTDLNFNTKQDQYIVNNFVDTTVPPTIETTTAVSQSLTIINQTLVISATSASFDTPIQFNEKIILASGGLAVSDPEENPYIVFGGNNEKIGHIPIIDLNDATTTDILNIDWNLENPNYYGMKYDGTFELNYNIVRGAINDGDTIQNGKVTVHANKWTDNPLVPQITHDVLYYINETDDPFLLSAINFDVVSAGTYIRLRGINTFGANAQIKGLYKMY